MERAYRARYHTPPVDRFLDLECPSAGGGVELTRPPVRVYVWKDKAGLHHEMNQPIFPTSPNPSTSRRWRPPPPTSSSHACGLYNPPLKMGPQEHHGI